MTTLALTLALGLAGCQDAPIAETSGSSSSGTGLPSSTGGGDDADASIYPEAEEVPYDGIDQDCDGADLLTCFVDDDGDGFGTTETTLPADGDCDDPGESPFATDCDDLDETIFPGAPETADDGIDQDCNGTDTITCYVDADRDGFGTDSLRLNEAFTSSAHSSSMCLISASVSLGYLA